MKRIILASLLAAQAPLLTHAQTSTVTDPLGFVSFPVRAGTVNAPSVVLLSVPLQDENAQRATVVAVTDTGLQFAATSWVPDELAEPAAPTLVRILSGSRAGALYSISGNTEDTLTLAESIAGSGLAAGNVVELVAAHTLGSLFGNTLLGGASAAVADNVIIVSGGVSLTYYYNADRSRWELNTDSTVSRDNVVIRPDAGFYLVRRGPAFNLVSTGRVPITPARIPVENIGNTIITYGFPLDVTIGQLALQNAVPGWRSSTDSANADWLSLDSSGTAQAYYFTGTNWRRTVGAPTNRDAIVIKAGSPITVTRSGAISGKSEYTKAKPY